MNSGGNPTRKSDEAERRAYIALAMVPRLGARGVARVLSAFGSASAAVSAPVQELMQRSEISHGLATAIRAPLDAQIESLLEKAERAGQHVLAPSDRNYPANLRSIPDPPILLFGRGNLAALECEGVAIVGSREHTRYGADVARQLARAAAGAGIPVISGMARGLDAAAQLAALDAGGTSIGLLGHGVDIVYPAENRALFDRMERDGLLLSEHPPGERPLPWSFPRRNRLISGLAKVLVVVEAAEGSGTLTTVASALEQGRDVLVVPGPIDSRTSIGTNRLLRDGATPILSPADLLAAFGKPRTVDPIRPDPPRADLSVNEALVIAGMSELPRTVDDIALAAGLPVGLLLGTLLGLELGGLVEQLPDSSYRRTTGRQRT